MRKAKYSYLDYILRLNPERKLVDYLSAIKELEVQVRCAYANEIKMDRGSFVRTLLLDGCFILVALNGTEGITPPTSHCNVLDTDTREVNADTEDLNHEYFLFDKTVSRDLLLLENQIPFSVVQKIHEVLSGRIDASSLLTKVITKTIASMIYCRREEIKDGHQPREIHHLVHLCHVLLKPNHLRNHIQKEYSNLNDWSKPQFSHQILPIGSKVFVSSKEVAILPDINPGSPKLCIQAHSWRPATLYYTARIEFKKKDTCGSPQYSLLDIGFSDGTMEIPSLTIDRRTYCLLRNLVAFEQACPQFGNYVSAYVVFWSQLVSTSDDAALLTDKGVITNQLQSDVEVARLFSSLSQDVALDPTCTNYLKPVCNMVEVHYQRQRPRWRNIFGTISSNVSHWVRNNF